MVLLLFSFWLEEFILGKIEIFVFLKGCDYVVADMES